MGSLADLCASEVITQKIDKAYEEGYNRAIDEFAEALKKEISFKYGSGQINHAYNAKEKTLKLIDEIAEEMRGAE